MKASRRSHGLGGIAFAFVGFAFVGFLEGCATIQSGEYGVPLDQPNQPTANARTASTLAISAKETEDFSSRYFGLVEVTFENKSPAWVQIDRVDLDFGSPDKNRSVLIPWGSDIDSWETAISTRNAIRAVNTETALALLALGGGIARAAGGHGTSGRVGGVIAAGALATLVGGELTDAAKAAERVDWFPATHLLNTPIRIPPGLFAKRWILFYTAEHPLGGCVNSLILGTEIANRRERVLLRFRNSYTYSEWQRDSCLGDRPGIAPQH